MDKVEILQNVELVLLKESATAWDYEKCCKVAESYGVAAVCVPSSWVEFCRKRLSSVKICAVVGFPAGGSLPEVKLFEAQRSIMCGADEIEMVINVSNALSAAWGNEHDGSLCDPQSKNAKRVLNPAWHDDWLDGVRWEIEQMRQLCSEGVALKVAIETRHLAPVQKIKLCQVAAQAGADYVKTSASGCELTDVREAKLLQESVWPKVKIIATELTDDGDLNGAKRLFAVGCDRVGSAGLMNTLVSDEVFAAGMKEMLNKPVGDCPEPYRDNTPLIPRLVHLSTPPWWVFCYEKARM